MKFLKALFGASAEKYEDKADELRLDFEYQDAAFYYQQAIDALEDDQEEVAERLKRKVREVRRKAFAQLLEEASVLIQKGVPQLAGEKLEMASNFADDRASKEEVGRRQEELAEVLSEEDPLPDEYDTVEGTEGDLFELALSGYEPSDREAALGFGEPFRLAFEACQREAWEDAKNHLTPLLEDHPKQPVVLELAAMVSDQSEHYNEAESYYRKSHEAEPFRYPAVQGLVNTYRRTNRGPEARSLLAEAAAFHPISPDLGEPWVQIHIDHAVGLSENGHHDEAIAVMLSLAEVKAANRGFVFFNLAGILERAGEDEDCRAALEQAIESSPRQPLYRERLADYFVKRRIELELALSLLVGANETETTSGGALLGGGGSGKAVASPNRARYLYKMARVYFLKGEDLEAEKTISSALAVSRDPEVIEALEGLRDELNAAQAES